MCRVAEKLTVHVFFKPVRFFFATLNLFFNGVFSPPRANSFNEVFSLLHTRVFASFNNTETSFEGPRLLKEAKSAGSSLARNWLHSTFLLVAMKVKQWTISFLRAVNQAQPLARKRLPVDNTASVKRLLRPDTKYLAKTGGGGGGDQTR